MAISFPSNFVRKAVINCVLFKTISIETFALDVLLTSVQALQAINQTSFFLFLLIGNKSISKIQKAQILLLDFDGILFCFLYQLGH